MKKIGFLGAGQLFSMSRMAGIPLGIDCVGYDPKPAVDDNLHFLENVTMAGWYDESHLGRFVDSLECITWEFENVPPKTAEFCASRKPFHPSTKALRISQNRKVEKEYLNSLGIPTVAWTPINTFEETVEAAHHIGVPVIIKTAELGHDGIGQRTINHIDEIPDAFECLEGNLILEKKVKFQREYSIIAACGRDGAIVYYPLIANYHHNGILRLSLSGVFSDEHVEKQAHDYVRLIAENLHYVGIMVLELFLTEDGQVLVNETAFRVHNSGHGTIIGNSTSQFTNHLLAVTGHSLGKTDLKGCWVMVNYIGQHPENGLPGAETILYGKQWRPGRKVGHGSFIADNTEDLLRMVRSGIEDFDEEQRQINTCILNNL